MTSDYAPKHPDTIRRVKLAMESWRKQMWNEFPVNESCGRRMTDEMGSMPFIRDILDIATLHKNPDTIIVFTNLDICTAELCSVRIAFFMQESDAAYCYRRDFKRLDSLLPDADISTGYLYPGSDLYAFRSSWWTTYRNYFPDMVIGRECWDSVLRMLINITNKGLPSEIKDIAYHERHPNSWEPPRNRYHIKGQLYNRSLAAKWMKDNNLDPRMIGL